MKWSQALCGSILVDGLCYAPPVARPNPQPDQDFPGLPADPAITPNALAADFGPPQKAGRTPLLDVARYGIMRRRRPSGSTIES
jgi:hypothetical protein